MALTRENKLTKTDDWDILSLLPDARNFSSPYPPVSRPETTASGGIPLRYEGEFYMWNGQLTLLEPGKSADDCRHVCSFLESRIEACESKDNLLYVTRFYRGLIEMLPNEAKEKLRKAYTKRRMEVR